MIKRDYIKFEAEVEHVENRMAILDSSNSFEAKEIIALLNVLEDIIRRIKLYKPKLRLVEGEK